MVRKIIFILTLLLVNPTNNKYNDFNIDNVKNIVEFAKGNIPVNEIAQCEAV